MREVTQSFQELSELIEAEYLRRLCSLRFDANREHELQPMLLGSSIIEQGYAICVLGKQNLSVQCHQLLRAMLEQVVALKLVLRTPAYMDGMRVSELRNDLKTFERAKKGNPYFARFLEVEGGLDARIAMTQAEIKALEGAGAKWGNIGSRFEVAEDAITYEGLYHILSDSSHSSYNALKMRHLDIEDGRLVARAFRSSEHNEMEPLRSSLIDSLNTTIELLEGCFSGNSSGP